MTKEVETSGWTPVMRAKHILKEAQRIGLIDEQHIEAAVKCAEQSPKHACRVIERVVDLLVARVAAQRAIRQY